MKIIKTAIVLLMLIQTTNIQAAMSDDLKNAFNKLTISTNFTKPDVYKGQEEVCPKVVF